VTVVEEQDRGYAAARRVREKLGLGLEAPLSDIVEVIEDLAAVPVTVLNLPPGIAGLQGRKQDRSFIFVNSDEAVVRQRFTLAHEFGHVSLSHGGSIDYTADVLGAARRPPKEVQADGFAAEFLAPLAGVRTWLGLVGEPPLSLDVVVRLANHFHVSAEVALYRLQAVWRLTKAKYRPLEEAIVRREHQALATRLGLRSCNDTLGRAKTLPPRLPRETITHAVTAYERGLLTPEQIAALLQIDVQRVQREIETRGVTPPESQLDY
jgi:Zn-dependent peptidase ImmA (M78 family)